ncbi:MAG: CRISPR-associated endonuclease Cas2 [Ruminiclostridium sp.]|nr:CRISPR-associated endonuclease Cas2 [Ruminiclostridium sp.]
MRMLVMFDLPVETNEDRRNYRKFRSMLMKNGFVMMQESVYCRMVVNHSVESAVIETIKKDKPPRGLVQVMSVTEKQFAKTVYIVGDSDRDVIDSDERLIIL